MTYEELLNSDKDILTPNDIAPLLKCDPNIIRLQARENISQLGFPATKIGSRVKIPRIGFLKWFEGSCNA